MCVVLCCCGGGGVWVEFICVFLPCDLFCFGVSCFSVLCSWFGLWCCFAVVVVASVFCYLMWSYREASPAGILEATESPTLCHHDRLLFGGSCVVILIHNNK